MIVVGGKYEEQDLQGIAYYNTFNTFFGPSYEEAASGIGSPSRFQIEVLSFRHEFGHTFGLVNIPDSGTEMQNPHQDTEHGHHYNNNNCLADLKANGGK